MGKFIVEHEKLDEIDIFQDTAKLTSRTKRVLLVSLEIENGNFIYKGIIEEELEKSKVNKYLYKGGPPNGVDYTPSSLITSKAGSTFKNRILKWFKTHKDPDFLDKIAEVLTNNKDQIISDLDEKFVSIDKKNRVNVLLTISILDGFKKKLCGDYNLFREILAQESMQRYHNLKTIGESSGEGTCYLCDESKEVYGFVPNAFGFSFSTADKKGNVPNFIQADQWKQVPICGECAVFLEAGKKFIQEYLSFNLFTLKFFVIPNFIFKGDLGEFKEFYDRVVYLKGKKYEKGLMEEEDDDEADSLYSIVKNTDDILEFKFLFYELKGGGKFIDILNYVESILPSWMKNIYTTQNTIKNDILFQEKNLKLNFGKKVDGNFIQLRNNQSKGYITQYNWYAGFLREFFPSKYDKYFLDIIGFIVGGKSVNKDFLISKFMDRIKHAYRSDPENDYSMKILTTEAIMLLMFFNELNLLKGVDKMKIGSHNEESNEKEFFEVYGEFVDTPEKKSAFLMGVITKRLTAIQYKSLGATPFMTKLWGLTLDQKKIQKLYPMIINKLREYKAAYPDLEELISINLLKSNNSWKLSGDETSFYFVLGFTLNGIFKSKKEGEKNE